MAEFTCLKCERFFDAAWDFDNVVCPHCKTEFETDFETDIEDSIQGPWLDKEAASSTLAQPQDARSLPKQHHPHCFCVDCLGPSDPENKNNPRGAVSHGHSDF